MIEAFWKESFVGHAAASLQRYYHSSLLGGINRAVKARYATSVTKQTLDRWSSNWPHTDHGFVQAFLNWIVGLMFALGQRLKGLWQTSIIGQTTARMAAAPALQQSAVWAGLRRLGVRRFLLLLFGLYLPIDFLLRQVPSLSGISAVWDELLLIVCLMMAVWEATFPPRKQLARLTPLDAPLLIFIAIALFLLFTNTDYWTIGVAGFRATVQYMVWFFILSRLIKTKADWQLVYMTILMLGIITGLHGIYQYIVGTPIPANWVSVMESGVRTRAFSIFGSPNIMGDFMVMTTPLAIAMAYKQGLSWEKRLAWWMAGGIMALGCIASFSRGAWLGLAVAILLFVFVQDRRLFIGLLIIVTIMAFMPAIMNRIAFLMTDDFAKATQTGGRGERWDLGMIHLRAAGPLFGMGLGRFGGAVAMQNQIIEGLRYFYMDNYYLKILVEMGYVGLVPFVLLVLSVIATGFRAILHAHGTTLRPQLVGIWTAMIGVLTHCLYENIFEVPYMNAYFWGLAALLVSSVFVLSERDMRANRKNS